jgi:hypothetical protein
VKRFALAVIAVFAAALLVGGCGGSSGGSDSTAPEGGAPEGGAQEGGAPKATAPNAPAGSRVVDCGEGVQLRATEVSCDVARATLSEWEIDPACTRGGASRSSCAIGDFRCQAVKVEAGTAVSCERPAATVSWLIRPAG